MPRAFRNRQASLWYFAQWAKTYADTDAEAERWIRLYLGYSLDRERVRQFLKWRRQATSPASGIYLEPPAR